VDAIVTLGCLLRGETAITRPSTTKWRAALANRNRRPAFPIALGVLTCETLEQALNRAGIKAGNKGFEAAVAAIEMVSLRRKLLQGKLSEAVRLDPRTASHVGTPQVARAGHADAVSGGHWQADPRPGARHILVRPATKSTGSPRLCRGSI